jgi:hypothetical protein
LLDKTLFYFEMKKIQILIIIFIILTLPGQAAGCAYGYFTDKSGPVGSNIDNNDDTATNYGVSPGSNGSGAVDSHIDNDDLQNNTDDTGNGTFDSSKDSGFDCGCGTFSNQTPQKYAIIASGASYDSKHYAWFLNSTAMAYKILKNNGYADEDIYYLFESAKEPNVDYQATIENFKKVIEELRQKSGKTDTILLFLIGHGAYRGTNSYYILNGYNLSDIEMAGMFKNVERDKLVFVFSPCNSGGFIDDLSGKNIVVITSTRKDETNSAAFIEPFLASFDGTGDTNSDGKVSFAEAFNYASNNVSEQYINNNWGAITEHAQLDDNGDAISHEAPVPCGEDGQLAEDIYLK